MLISSSLFLFLGLLFFLLGEGDNICSFDESLLLESSAEVGPIGDEGEVMIVGRGSPRELELALPG